MSTIKEFTYTLHKNSFTFIVDGVPELLNPGELSLTLSAFYNKNVQLSNLIENWLINKHVNYSTAANAWLIDKETFKILKSNIDNLNKDYHELAYIPKDIVEYAKSRRKPISLSNVSLELLHKENREIIEFVEKIIDDEEKDMHQEEEEERMYRYRIEECREQLRREEECIDSIKDYSDRVLTNP